jgi:hypothetical protein
VDALGNAFIDLWSRQIAYRQGSSAVVIGAHGFHYFSGSTAMIGVYQWDDAKPIRCVKDN